MEQIPAPRIDSLELLDALGQDPAIWDRQGITLESDYEEGKLKAMYVTYGVRFTVEPDEFYRALNDALIQEG